MDSSLQSYDQQITTVNTAAEFLRLRYKYGHLSFKRLRLMAKLGIIPNNFSKCDTPTCTSCVYAKSTHKPWNGRSINTPHKPRQVTYPRKIVFVDQLVSTTQGIVAQITDILTTKRYKYATVFLDHLSRYSYMHLQQIASSEDTVEGTHAFERMTASHGIIIKQYHA